MYVFLDEHLPKSWAISVDLPGLPCVLPSVISNSSPCPDIILWCQKSNEISLLELTVCFKENFTISSEYKKNKYSNLVSACKRAGWSAQLHTLQVGSRGLVDFSSFEPILRFLKFSKPSSTSCSERCAEFALAHCLQSGVEQIQTVRWTQTYLCKCSNSFNSVFFSFDSCCLLLFSLVFSDLLILRRTSCT